MTKLTINKDLNGIELSFDSKPATATLDALKASGFRWHHVKKVWYAKQTAERLALAQSIAGEQAEPKHDAPKAAKTKPADVINLENLGEGTRQTGADLAKAIREDLKRRGVTGCTVRSRYVGYTTGITVTVKATAEDFASVEECEERYNLSRFGCDLSRSIYTGGRWISYNDFGKMSEAEKEETHRTYIIETLRRFSSVSFGYSWVDRSNYWELSTKFFDKLTAIYKISNQWNYCNDDIMTDYFDRGYYLDIDIKKPEEFEPRESMTEAERAAYEAEKKAEEERRAEEMRKYKEEQEEARKAREKYEAWRTEARAEIFANAKIEDLAEPEYITGLSGGYGKEATLDELREAIKEKQSATREALITRCVWFTSEKAYNSFCKLFLDDFDFLAEKGGQGTQDVRLSDYDQYIKMTQEQRETVKFYMNDCVAVYLNGALSLVIDPEGYSYARYVYIPGEESKTEKAAPILEEQKNASETKPAFYFPEPIASQAANLHEGQAITIYQCDGWNLNSIYAGSGIVTGFYMGTYAQYTGLWVKLLDAQHKTRSVFVRDNNDCLIYEGIKNKLPDEVTRRQITPTMCELLNCDELIPNTYNYYNKLGETPIIDTCRR